MTNWQIVKLDHIVSHDFFKRTDIKIWNIVRIELIWSVKSKRTTYWCVVCRRERYFNVMALYRGLYMHNSMPYGNNFVILIFGMSGILIFTFVNCFLFFCNKIPTSFTCECNNSILCISVMTCKVSSLTTKSNEMLNNMIWTHYWNYSKYLLMNNLLFCNVNHNIYSLVYSIMAANTMSITEISGNVW